MLLVKIPGILLPHVRSCAFPRVVIRGPFLGAMGGQVLFLVGPFLLHFVDENLDILIGIF